MKDLRQEDNPGWVATPTALAREVAEAALVGAAAGGARVLDPACGTGDLLLAALEVLVARGADPGRAAEGLFGIERDPERVATARRRLRAATGAALPGLDARIRVADALDPAEAWPGATRVVANPPWVSFSGRQAGRLAPVRRALYEAAWSAFRTWPSLHGAFFQRIAEHVGSEGTRAAVLLPEAVTELEGYAPTRRAVERSAALAEPPRLLGEERFPGVTEPAALIVIEPHRRGGVLERTSAAGAPWLCRGGASGELGTWAVERLRDFPRLAPRSFADPGVHTGNASRALVCRDGAPAPPSSPHSASPSDHQPPTTPETKAHWAPVREGRDLAPFALRPARARLRVDLEPGDGRRFRRAALEHYRAFPVLLRQTASRPIAALHTEPTYFRNSLLACRALDELDPAFVVAVLNGAAAGAWHRVTSADARQRRFPQVKVGALATLPFPITSRSAAPGEHDAIAHVARELQLEPACAADAELARKRQRELEERLAALHGFAPDEAAALRRLAEGGPSASAAAGLSS